MDRLKEVAHTHIPTLLILQSPLLKCLISIACQLHTASCSEGLTGRSLKLHLHSVINVDSNFPTRSMCYFWCSGVYVCYHVDYTLILRDKASARKVRPDIKIFDGIN